MVDKSILFEAKAFLCWDKFPQLTIKLIPIRDEVAFFYPPSKDASTIVLFYNPKNKDFSHSLFLLFHEVGHFQQWLAYSAQNRSEEYWELIHVDKCEGKIRFEQEAWTFAHKLILDFSQKQQMQTTSLLEKLNPFIEECIQSYL